MLLTPLTELPLRLRAATGLAMACAALLFCLPFILCVALDAGFLSLANEPLAYRFFYSERIFAGELVVVGVGYLVSVLHHVVYASMHLFPAIANSTLEHRLDLFALLTNGALSAALCAIFYFAVVSKDSTLFDLALLALVALMPIYGTVVVGFDYVLMADYHFLNIVFCVATLFIFQQLWRRGDPVSRRSVLLLGAFVGLAMANKITLLVMTGVVLVPAVATGRGWREFSIRSLLAGAGLIPAYFAVHLASYLGSVRKMSAALRAWWDFASNPGEEPTFWDHLFNGFIQGYNYDYFILYSIGVFVVTVLIVLIRRKAGWLTALTMAFCAAAFLACMYFIVKRPAGSTLFESTMFCFTLSAVLLTTVSAWRPVQYATLASCVAWLGFAAMTFSVSTVYGQITRSRVDSHVKWSAFDEVRRLAGELPIEVIFPDNSFRHEGPFELLFKAATDFPTWDITTGQKTVLDRYAPGMSFRHNFGTLKPGMPYDDSRVLVWFDRDATSRLLVEYLELAKAVARPGVKHFEPAGYSFLPMHVAVIPSRGTILETR